jgi:hypothetical protein
MDFTQNTVFNGLGIITFIAPFAGDYTFSGKITLPTATNSGTQSQLVVTINKNGASVYTGLPAAEGYKLVQNLLTTDTITIVFSSSAPVDQGLNVIKTSLSVNAGP